MKLLRHENVGLPEFVPPRGTAGTIIKNASLAEQRTAGAVVQVVLRCEPHDFFLEQ